MCKDYFFPNISTALPSSLERISAPAGVSPLRTLTAAFLVSESAARYGSTSFFSVAVSFMVVPELLVVFFAVEEEEEDVFFAAVEVELVFFAAVEVEEVFFAAEVVEAGFLAAVEEPRFFGASSRDFCVIPRALAISLS